VWNEQKEAGVVPTSISSHLKKDEKLALVPTRMFLCSPHRKVKQEIAIQSIFASFESKNRDYFPT